MRVRVSIKSKIIILWILACIVPIAVLGGYIYFTSVAMLKKQASTASVSTLNRVGTFIETYMLQISNYSYSIGNDSDIISFMHQVNIGNSLSEKELLTISSAFDGAGKNLTIPLDAYLITNNEAFFCNFYTSPTDIATHRETVDQIVRSDWYQISEYETQLVFAGVQSDHGEQNSPSAFYFIQNVYDQRNMIIGKMVLRVDSYVFTRLLSSWLINSGDDIFLIGDNEILASSGTTSLKILDLAQSEKNGFIIAELPLFFSNWSLVYSYNYINTISEAINLPQILLLVVALLFCFGFLTLLYVKKAVVKPIVGLSHNISKYNVGNHNAFFYYSSNDEIGCLSDGYNRMLLEINKSVEQIRENEHKIKELEFSVLQAQIKPHFLYNSLNSIKIMSNLAGSANITSALQSLIHLLQYTVGNINNNMTTLEEEIKYIESYVYFNNLRFMNKFNLILSVPQEVQGLQILKFLIQPFVENSIIHGSVGKPGAMNIRISVAIENGNIVITESDDGTGFDMKCMPVPNNAEENKAEGSTHFGIHNIENRIKLIYGDPYGIWIISDPGKGTSVTITVPIIE